MNSLSSSLKTVVPVVIIGVLLMVIAVFILSRHKARQTVAEVIAPYSDIWTIRSTCLSTTITKKSNIFCWRVRIDGDMSGCRLIVETDFFGNYLGASPSDLDWFLRQQGRIEIDKKGEVVNP